MDIEVHYKDASKSLHYQHVENAYVKDGLYCVYIKEPSPDGSAYRHQPGVYKHPLANVWRIHESYS